MANDDHIADAILPASCGHHPVNIPAMKRQDLSSPRRSLAGSLIGGIRETQEMLDFCAENNVAADIEVIPNQEINIAHERMLKNDVRYRFVIDLASLKTSAS